MRLLCIAAKHGGYVAVNGRGLEAKEISRLVGVPEEDTQTLIDELESNGVFSRDKGGVIYSRRIVKDEKNRKNGQLGGNPKLLETKGTADSVNPSPGRVHKPEAISQTKKENIKERKFMFSGQTVKLNEADYAGWKKAYSNIPDLNAELQRIDDALTVRGITDWFCAASAMLNAKHQSLGKQGDLPPPKNPGYTLEMMARTVKINIVKDYSYITPEKIAAMLKRDLITQQQAADW